jgi:hypothetical protein
VNQAQDALLNRLREIIEEIPESGAVNAAKRPLSVSRFAEAVESRADDGDALVAYARAKVHGAPMASYKSLINAERPELTVEALVADADAPWAGEFSDDDRAAAQARLGTMIEARRRDVAAEEVQAVKRDRTIVAQVNENRLAKGTAGLTPEQKETMLGDLAARRARTR